MTAQQESAATDLLVPTDVLETFVRIATGNEQARPREGQLAAFDSVVAALEVRGARVATAPTGSGKSAILLSAAVHAALTRAERSVISTDSLALMSQFQSKDVPTVLAAAGHLAPDLDVAIAFVKGVANYVDPAAVIAAAQTVTGQGSSAFRSLLRAVESIPADTPLPADLRLDEEDNPGAPTAFRELLVWGLRAYLDDEAEGSRHTCQIPGVTDQMWSRVSASADMADDGDRFGVVAKAKAARERAASADIVITNHAVLAVQAANGIPAIIGSQSLGRFDHLLIDEAHALPGRVRDQGAKTVSAEGLRRIARSAFRAAGSPSGARGWLTDAERLGDELDRELRAFLASGSGPERGSGVRRMGTDDRPLAHVEGLVVRWVATGKKLVRPSTAPERPISTVLRAKAALQRLEELEASVTTLGRHRSGWARWVERKDGRDSSVQHVAALSPIDVGFLLKDDLYEFVPQGADRDEVRPVSVVAVSATMPGNAPYQLGLSERAGQLVKYPSPFTDAYAKSMLFVPSAQGGELPNLTSSRYGKPSFDTAKHAEWATAHIVRLVGANRGSALILAATAENGRRYAEALRRAMPDLDTFSQWDGGNVQGIVDAWRDDHGSVLVGTRSLMTGVDAPGATNTLVVVDRVPRSPGNPVDDARVDQIAERTNDRFGAVRSVYAMDATLLLTQAVGRLIRATSDRGCVAVLDPRLLKAPIPYDSLTRDMYLGALDAFGTKFTSIEKAEAWIRSNLSTAA